MQATNHLPIGSLLQGAHTYKIEQVLGQGSFGITYLASTRIKVDGALGALEVKTTVAIKEFFMRDINERAGEQVSCGSKDGIYAHYRHKFAREAENLSKLRHPNIVRVLEAFEANNTVYYAMEYCEGGSLDYLIGRDGLAEGQALAFVRQIASALDYMHRARILHLDLKPGNVMLREDGTVALIDFGLSKQYDEAGEPESSTTIGGGTPGYAPIEQVHYREGRDFPIQMDIYALGATLYKMLMGERPAEAAVLLNEGFPAHRLADKGVSEPTIAVIEKAMSPIKRNRYGSVAEFLAALDSGTEGPVEPEVGENTVIEISANEETVVDQPAETRTPKPSALNPTPSHQPQPAPTTPTPLKIYDKAQTRWVLIFMAVLCMEAFSRYSAYRIGGFGIISSAFLLFSGVKLVLLGYAWKKFMASITSTIFLIGLLCAILIPSVSTTLLIDNLQRINEESTLYLLISALADHLFFACWPLFAWTLSTSKSTKIIITAVETILGILYWTIGWKALLWHRFMMASAFEWIASSSGDYICGIIYAFAGLLLYIFYRRQAKANMLR